MNETKWTPPPWQILHSIDRDGFVIKAQPSPVLRGFTVEVALVQHEEDAHLLAAAPELYEVLAQALDYIHSLPTQNQKAFRKIDVVIHRALAKARGETK